MLQDSRFLAIQFFSPLASPVYKDDFSHQEYLRRGQLLVLLVFCLLLVAGIIFPVGFFLANKLVLVFLAVLIGIYISTLFLNKAGHIQVAGSIVVLATEATLLLIILTTRPFDAFNLPLFDLLSIPVCLSVMLLPPLPGFFIPVVINIGSMFWALIYQQHTPTFTILLKTQFYNAMVRPAMLQFFLAVFFLILISNMQAVRKRAFRAEEIIRLQREIELHQERTIQEKKALEDDIEYIVRAHISWMRGGELIEKIPLARHHALLQPLIHVFNNLFDRLFRAQQSEKALTALLAEIGFWSQKLQSEERISVPPNSLLMPLIRAFMAREHYKRVQKLTGEK